MEARSMSELMEFRARRRRMPDTAAAVLCSLLEVEKERCVEDTMARGVTVLRVTNPEATLADEDKHAYSNAVDAMFSFIVIVLDIECFCF
jgi:hypothetical protein